MLLCSVDLDSRVDEVVVVKIVCVATESSGVPQVTLKFPPRPPKTHLYILSFSIVLQCRLYILPNWANNKKISLLDSRYT